jgi:hypothetical protein
MRRFVIAALLLSILAAATPPDYDRKRIGIYHWGGTVTTSVSEGVERIASTGLRNARIALSPRYLADYNLAQQCFPQFTLTLAAQQADVKAAFDQPGIDVLMITAYDGVTFGDCVHHQYLNPRFYTSENTDAIVREYSDFTLWLYETYRNTHKRFIIANWESDNAVYCGQAYTYATVASFRAACDANYPQGFEGNASPSESLEGLKLWMQARRRGIDEGRSRAAALGYGGPVRVFLAVEFCIIHALHDAGFGSVLYDVLPKLVFDFASYSAYESTGRDDPAASLRSDLDLLRQLLGSDAIILGEIGFSRSQYGADRAVERTDAVLKTALDWGVAYVFQWNLYDQGSNSDFGLFDTRGEVTALGRYYIERMRSDE